MQTDEKWIITKINLNEYPKENLHFIILGFTSYQGKPFYFGILGFATDNEQSFIQQFGQQYGFPSAGDSYEELLIIDDPSPARLKIIFPYVKLKFLMQHKINGNIGSVDYRQKASILEYYSLPINTYKINSAFHTLLSDLVIEEST